MWAEIFGAAIIFGAIVAIGAWANGRRTTRLISNLIKEENKGIREILSTHTNIFGKTR